MIAYDDIEAMVWPWPAALDAAFADGIRPEPDVTIAEWAELHRWVSAEGSSSVGPWRNDKTPYLRAIMEDLSPSSRVEKVVFEANDDASPHRRDVVFDHPGGSLAILINMRDTGGPLRLDWAD